MIVILVLLVGIACDVGAIVAGGGHSPDLKQLKVPFQNRVSTKGRQTLVLKYYCSCVHVFYCITTF